MSFWRLALMVAIMAALFAVTLPVELRPKRWVRLILSLPFVWALSGLFLMSGDRVEIMTGNLAATLCFFILAIIWKGPFAYHGSRVFTGLMFGDGRAGGSIHPDLRHSHTLIKEGRFEEARKEIEMELEKSNADYEGRLLLASLDCHLNNPKAARQSIDILKRSPWLTEVQKDEVRRADAEVELLQIKLDGERNQGKS